MLRYAVIGVSLGGLGFVVESWSVILSALFYVPSTMTVPMLAVTGMAWTGFRLME